MSKSKILNSPSSEKNEVMTGCLVIISAPSGCGKTTLVDRLLKRHPEWVRSVSVTTRPPRAGEEEGKDYFFLAPAAFKKAEAKGELLEWASVFHHSYGTPKAFVLEQIKKGNVVILAIDVQGTKIVKKNLDKKIPLLTLFVLPPSLRILRERLEGRKTDSAEEIERRIETAQEEIKEASGYDRTVINQNLEQTVLEIENYIESFHKSRRHSKNGVRST